MQSFKILRSICLIVFVLFMGQKIIAQQSEVVGIPDFDPAFEVFELPNGLMGNSVQGIVQDSVGFLWFASQSGLHRYDGQNITTFVSDPNNPNTLNNDYIEYIYLDSKGMIWLSHWSAGGVSLYDPDRGTFTRYIHDRNDPETILFGETSPIVEDKDSYIWIGGRNGLSRLDRESGKFKRYSHDPNDPNSLSDNEVRNLYVDTSGDLWVATGMPWTLDDKGGLNRYSPETDSFERYMHDPDDPNSISNNKVKALFEDSKGNFWVGTAGDGLHQFNKEKGTFKRFSYDPQNPGKLSKPFLTGTELSTSSPWSHITSIFEDNRKRLWITAVYDGINVYDPKLGATYHFESKPGNDKLNTNFIWQTFQSNDGTIWIATGGDGTQVYKVREEGLKIPYYSPGPLDDLANDPPNVKRGIIKDDQNKIWVAQSPPTPGDPDMISMLWQVDMEKDTAFQVYFSTLPKSQVIPTFLSSMSQDSDGNIWVSTSDGYYKSTDENIMEKVRIDYDSGFIAAPMLQTSTGDIWISSMDNGVFRFDSSLQKSQHFIHDLEDPGSIAGDIVWGLYEDRKGNVWFGGGSYGNDPNRALFLDRYNPESNTFEHFIDQFTSLGMAAYLVEDLQGNLWFSDWYYSLYRLNPVTKELKRFTSGNSLLTGNRIQSIIQHPTGSIWISTDHELLELDPVTEAISIYNKIHGVRPARGNTSAGFITEDGELLFMRESGFNVFHPDSLLDEVKTKLPDLRITGFRLSDENMMSGVSDNSESVLGKPIWKTDLIELNSDENTFSFAVACLDFYEPEANQLQYKLEGYDLRWRQNLLEGETPSYFNVPPGQYTFRLRGANSLGVWNTEGISLKVIINPPWYQTWWAYLVYSIIFVAFIVGIHTLQKNRTIRKERERIKDWELEQAKKVEQAYEELKNTQTQLIHSEKMASLGELTAGIAHEIQNPLNFVNNFSEVNKELVEEMREALEKNDIEDAKSIAKDLFDNEDKVIHHGKRASGIVKAMLDHSRAGSNEKVLTDINTLADEYLRLAYHGFRAKDKSFNVEFSTEFASDLPKVNIVSQDIGRVLLNLINNAFQAVRDAKNPEVILKTQMEEGKVLIIVKDNGNGIPDDIKEKIFQPFFTTKAAGEGTGLGLSLSYDIITKGHGGNLSVKSQNGHGSEFVVKIPVNNHKE